MWREELISKLIGLEEQAKVYTSEYMRLIQGPGNVPETSFRQRKTLRLRSRLRNLMRQIALLRGRLHACILDKNTDLNS